MSSHAVMMIMRKYGLYLGVPAAAVLSAAFLPLRPVIREGMVGVILVWLQAGLIFGVIKN